MNAVTAEGTDPAARAGEPEGASYHGRPVLKEPAWTWEVPWYLFVGGLAGASSMVCVGARWTGQTALADRARTTAAGAALLCPPLLISDLGRPSRFINMLRVFKPTSVMSVGSWTLATYSSAAIGSAGLALLGRTPRLQSVADAAAGATGMVMVTYTGALMADSSIPVWHEARRELPMLFASSSLASAGAGALLAGPATPPAPARRLAIGAALAEFVVDRLMRRRLDGAGGVGNVYDQSDAGRFHLAATVANGLGAAALAAGGAGGAARRRLARAGALALMVGSICQRWSVFRAGFQSARDPQATLAPQRERLARGRGHRKASPVA